MPKYLQPYVCPRCNYTTPQKKQINRHFYRTKKNCPDSNNILLTDAIKKHVIDNHIYHIQKNNHNERFRQNINYNFILNYVNGLDYLEKVNKMLQYENTKMICFEEQLEQRFNKRVNHLENRDGKTHILFDQEGLFRIIDEATRNNPKEIEKFAIFLDKTVHRLKIYLGNEWDIYMEEEGIKKLIDLIKSYYMDTYEMYLIKNLYTSESIKTRCDIKAYLDIYYKFLAIFGLWPNTTGKTDTEILGHRMAEDSDFHIEEACLKIYKEQKELLKSSEKNNIKKKILNIVRDNTVQNIQNINKLILELLKIDSEFKNNFLETSLNEFEIDK